MLECLEIDPFLAVTMLAPEEHTTVTTFKALFNALPWKQIDTHPFISDLPKKGEEMVGLLPAAKDLHPLLERRISCFSCTTA